MQFQEQAKNRALADDVGFVIDGFREGSALATCALKAMALFADARSRQGMAEVRSLRLTGYKGKPVTRDGSLPSFQCYL